MATARWAKSRDRALLQNCIDAAAVVAWRGGGFPLDLIVTWPTSADIDASALQESADSVQCCLNSSYGARVYDSSVRCTHDTLWRN